MQPKGALSYIFDGGRWAPWNGSGAGFGGVTLYTPAGVAVDTPTGTADNVTTANLLGVGGFTFVFDGTNWDRAKSLVDSADAVAVGVSGLLGTVNKNYGFNGTTWDRLRSFAGNADDITSPTLGLLGVGGFNFLFDGTNWDRAKSLVDSADAVAVGVSGLLGTVNKNYGFNGTTWDRLRSASATNISAQSGLGAQLVSLPGDWAITHAPAAATLATITRAAGAVGVRHVATCISVSFVGNASAVFELRNVRLRDGATGAGTILWSQNLIAIPSGMSGLDISGLNIVGSAATAMTLEFDAAGAANTTECVSLTGHDVS